jgi:hypothetical protein
MDLFLPLYDQNHGFYDKIDIGAYDLLRTNNFSHLLQTFAYHKAIGGKQFV